MKIYEVIDSFLDFLERKGSEYDFAMCYYSDLMDEERRARKKEKELRRKCNEKIQ